MLSMKTLKQILYIDRQTHEMLRLMMRNLDPMIENSEQQNDIQDTETEVSMTERSENEQNQNSKSK